MTIIYKKNGDIITKTETTETVYSLSATEKLVIDLETEVETFQILEYPDKISVLFKKAIDLKNEELLRDKEIIENGDLVQAKELLNTLLSIKEIVVKDDMIEVK